jgi:hypothetical protein
MRSFKEYLAEGNDHWVEPIRPLLLQIKVRGDDYISPKYNREQLFQRNNIISRELSELCEKANLPKVKEVYHFGVDRVTFHLVLEPHTHYTKPQLDTIATKFIKLADKYEIYKNDFEPVSSEMPVVILEDNFDKTTTVEVNHVIIEESVKSLQDIHKVILSAKQISMGDSSNITQNVLGLLKIKNAITLYASAKVQWFNIVKEYFDTGKDFIACQRKLIELDLDDYAEL